MDITARARSLLEPIPAHRTAGITVVRAADGAAEVELVTPPGLTNVIGSLHSSGLIALAYAAGLAAIIAASRTVRDLEGVLAGVAGAVLADVESLKPVAGKPGCHNPRNASMSGAVPLGQPLRVGPGVLEAEFDPGGQRPGEHQAGSVPQRVR